MKTLLAFVCLLATVALVAPAPAPAQSIVENYAFTPNALVPDNASSGFTDQRTLASAITQITSLSLTLTIAGGYTGDYYAYLTHTDGSGALGFAVLLNRVGSNAGNPFGYVDAGFTSVTFTSMIGAPDIHDYQSTQNPGGGPLVGGVWSADGRNVSPYGALDTSPRTALLNSFAGLDANGAWTLFLADVAPAGQGTLVSWSLQIVGVPEPGTWIASVFALGALGWRQRQRGGRPPSAGAE